jgi:prepilin-type processing-associated H-X9-DG protein
MELLVVISILVLLIAMIQPSLGSARESARAAICRSNLRQVSIGSTLYADETGYMPTGYNGSDIVWIPEIFEHAGGDTDLFYCPSALAKAKMKEITFGSGLPAQWGYKQDQVRIKTNEFFSYGHNNGGSADGNGLGVGDAVSLGWNRASVVKSPTEFIMYGDSTVDGLWDHFIDEDVAYPTRNEYPAPRHSGGANIAFDDNHVEHIQQKYLIYSTPEGTQNPEWRRMWNNDNLPH